MKREWEWILTRFGQSVILRGQGVESAVRAFVQPLLDRGREQRLPGPLGLGRQDRLLYLGPAGHPLDLDTLVEWKGREYQVRAAHLTGEGVCPCWWAVLCPREEVRP